MARSVDWLGDVTARHGRRRATAASAACCAGTSMVSTRPRVPELPVPQDRILVLRRDGMDWFNRHAAGSPGDACAKKKEPEQRLLRLFPVTSNGRSMPVAQTGRERPMSGTTESRPVTHTLLATRDRRI